MIKLIWLLVLSLIPALVSAQSGSLSFAPPPSDYSVIFLGNMFGVVDGVLHGTGSQIMGTMFAVFNSAVLALGGIIIMYTLMVSTMNTAHEGQMLGQKWSSIWIPVRSTLGLALLIPKASGYCLMQIFVMWLVVQGVGAADKIWDAALSYLNRGGVIIQAQATNPADVLTSSGTSGVANGASVMLAGQVCMLGLQKQLERQKQRNMDQTTGTQGPCITATGGNRTPSPAKVLCDTPIPDLIGSVNVVVTQSQMTDTATFTLPMPNLDPTTYPEFSFLNGICGTLTWSRISELTPPPEPQTAKQKKKTEKLTQLGLAGKSKPTGIAAVMGLSSSELKTVEMSRAIAMQQMYLELSGIAQIIVNNSPELNPSTTTGSTPYSPIATQQFGIPYTINGTACNVYDDTCTTWGLSGGTNDAGMLFSGTEFLGAISTYNAVMMPTLNLIKASNQAQSSNQAREFLRTAGSQGWVMAGAYFFDLVKLNGNAAESANNTDTNTGMGTSQIDPTKISGACDKNDQYEMLCDMFNKSANKVEAVKKLEAVESLIDGTSLGENVVPSPNAESSNANRKVVANAQSSTVNGYVNNSLMVQLPGQPGMDEMKFSHKMTVVVDVTNLKLKKQKFNCGGVTILFFKFCLGWMMGNIFYNLILLNIYNVFLTIVQQTLQQVVMSFIMIPLMGMTSIFKQGVQTLSNPGINPIVALANMGIHYINFSGNIWLMLIGLSIATGLIPIFGPYILALFALAMPIVFAWIGIMTAIGFATAYYVPLLPYMMFTFGGVAWLMSVIEAMVAAPIVALGVTHPEGHDAFGKGEQAIMILLNVFLRPAMMIIGYISAISLSYVGVWMLNAGFDHAISFMQGGELRTPHNAGNEGGNIGNMFSSHEQQGAGSAQMKYTGWAGIFSFFFSILSYTMMYMIIVQKSFTLISYLPDKVLRWIGGTPENLGQESASWGDELKQSSKDAATKSFDATGGMAKQAGGKAIQAVGAVASKASGAGGGEGGVDLKGGK